MPPPTPTFAKLCAAAQPKIDIPNKQQQQQFPADSGISFPPNISVKELNERCATLVWARTSLSAAEDPDSWSTTLDAALHPTLLGLYLLPPHRGPGAPPSNFARLARTIELYDPTFAVAAGAAEPAAGNAASAAAFGTLRPTLTGTSSAPPAPGLGAQALQPSLPLTSPADQHKRTHMMMHDELAAVLDPVVYLALDVAAGFEPEKRAKFHKACKESGVTTVLDTTVSAAFGHQMVLSIAEGQHFDPIRRGRALAIAGRSAPVGDSGFSEALSPGRETHLLALQKLWPTLFLAMHGDHEIANTMVNNLWSGVTFVFTLRAARATHWNCKEVEDACRLQLHALPSYRSAISNAAARLAAAYDAPENARQVNRNYAGFFLPFWWEHILLRGILDPAEHQKIIDKLCSPAALPPAPAPAPAPAPPPAPAALPPPAYQQPHAYPGWAPPFTLPPHMGVAFHVPPLAAPPYGPPFAPGPPPPYAPLAALTPTPRPEKLPFVGKTVSPLICGNNFGIILPGTPRTCSCLISLAFPGRIHHPFECPLCLHQQKGACPGWTPAGQRIPSAWAGDNITTATQAEWRTLQATLTSAIVAKGTPDITF
jgi:hypothetical protein